MLAQKVQLEGDVIGALRRAYVLLREQEVDALDSSIQRNKRGFMWLLHSIARPLPPCEVDSLFASILLEVTLTMRHDQQRRGVRRSLQCVVCLTR